jgi:hypothetical protein
MPFKSMSSESLQWFLIVKNVQFLGFKIYYSHKTSCKFVKKDYKILLTDFYHQLIYLESVSECEGTQIQIMHLISSSIYALNKAKLVEET